MTAAILLPFASLGASIVLIDETFSTNTVSNWTVASASTLTDAGSVQHISAGSQFDYGPHDGVMRWRPNHLGTASDQATLIYQISGVTENASGFTFSTTGIHAQNNNVAIRLAIQFVDNSVTQWAVSNQSIRTSTGTSAPVPGSWALSSLTFSSLNIGNLNAGPGSALDTATVLENVTGIGVYSRFVNQQWQADRATQIDSFTVIPEPRTYAAIFGLMALGLILYRRRR
ncbi:MAG: PEP-CTERM sorting domain-containing protein [Opitutales bacterium]|nr:PEP-CTERM sorting domain-containing protein [Opitutales bacterium]